MTMIAKPRDLLDEAEATIRFLGFCGGSQALGELLMALADPGRCLRLDRLQGMLDTENTRLAVRLFDEYLSRRRSCDEWLALGETARRVALPEEKFTWECD
jgi:hypothetical protein